MYVLQIGRAASGKLCSAFKIETFAIKMKPILSLLRGEGLVGCKAVRAS